MKSEEIQELIDAVHYVAANEKCPEKMRRRLANLLLPALERTQPVS